MLRLTLQKSIILIMLIISIILIMLTIISKIKKIRLSTIKKNINIIKTFIIKTRLSKIFKTKYRKPLTKILLI